MRNINRPAAAATALFVILTIALCSQCLAARHAAGKREGKIANFLRHLLPPWFNHERPKPPVPTPPPIPDPPEPIPPPIPPIPDAQQTVVGVWDTLASPANLSNLAHSHDLAQWLDAHQVSWYQLDPAIATQQPPPPAWCKAIFDAAAADKLTPPYMLVLVGNKPRAPHQLDALETLQTIQGKIADDLPLLPPAPAANMLGKGTGLLHRKPQAKLLAPNGQPTPKLSTALKPLPPAEYPACDLRTAIPIIDDQGGTSLCTSYAGVLLTEHARYVQFGRRNVRRLSAANLATRINGWDGASLTDVITALTADGVCTEAVHPEHSNRLPKNWQADARNNRWLKWYDAPDANPMGYTAASLARGLPCIVGIGVGGSFSPDAQGRITYARGSGRGGHAVVACGHTPAGDTGFTLIANSWGKDWGQSGFAWIEDRFIEQTDFDGPYVCTAVSAAAADTGPPFPTSRSLAVPVDEKAAATCPDGICPIKPTKRRWPRLDRPGLDIPSQTTVN